LWHQPHYVAPFTAAVVLGTVAVLRAVEGRRFARVRWGRVVLAAILLLAAGNTATRCFYAARSVRWSGDGPWQRRHELAQQLRAMGGRHLVFARSENIYRDWSYNLPDFDHQPVLWARPRAPQQQAALEGHYADRWVWQIDPEDQASKLLLRRPPLGDDAQAHSSTRGTTP
jgi:hypothetical protein